MLYNMKRVNIYVREHRIKKPFWGNLSHAFSWCLCFWFSSSHGSVRFLYLLLYFWFAGSWCLSPEVTAWEVAGTLDRSRVQHRHIETNKTNTLTKGRLGWWKHLGNLVLQQNYCPFISPKKKTTFLLEQFKTESNEKKSPLAEVFVFDLCVYLQIFYPSKPNRFTLYEFNLRLKFEIFKNWNFFWVFWLLWFEHVPLWPIRLVFKSFMPR